MIRSSRLQAIILIWNFILFIRGAVVLSASVNEDAVTGYPLRYGIGNSAQASTHFTPTIEAPLLQHAFNVFVAPRGRSEAPCGEESRPCSLAAGVKLAVEGAERQASREARVVLRDGIYMDAVSGDEPQVTLLMGSNMSIEIVAISRAIFDCDNTGSAFYLRLTSMAKVVMRHVSFKRCTNTKSAATWRKKPKAPMHMEVFDDSNTGTGVWFENCTWEENDTPWAGPVQLIFYTNITNSIFSFRNCQWKSNHAGSPGGGAVWVIDAGEWDDCDKSAGCWDPLKTNLTLTESVLSFRNSTWVDNTVDNGAGVVSTVLGKALMQNWSILVEDSLFENNTLGAAGCLQIQQGWPYNESHVNSLDWSTDANRVVVRRTSFVKCTSAWNAAFEFGAPHTAFNNTLGSNQVGYLAYKYQTGSVLEDVMFQDNFARGGSGGGAVSYVAGSHLLERVSFLNNTAAHSVGAIFIKEGSNVNMSLIDVFFKNNTAKNLANTIGFLGGGPLAMKNVTMHMTGSDSGVDDFLIVGGDSLNVDSSSRFVCPLGSVLMNRQAGSSNTITPSNAKCNATSNCYGAASSDYCAPFSDAGHARQAWLQQTHYSTVELNLGCSFCPVTTYSILTPTLHGPLRCDESISNRRCIQGYQSDKATCHGCPLGAQCTAWIPQQAGLRWGIGHKDILVNKDYFPYVCETMEGPCRDVTVGDDSSIAAHVLLVQCPHGYCCSSRNNMRCKWNKPCAKNREGILCGDCIEHTSASFSSAECVSNKSCNSWWYMLPLYFLLLFTYAFYLHETSSRSYSMIDQVLLYYQMVPYALPKWTNRIVILQFVGKLLSFNPTSTSETYSSAVKAEVGCLFPGMTPLTLKLSGFVTAALLSLFVGMLAIRKSKMSQQVGNGVLGNALTDAGNGEEMPLGATIAASDESTVEVGPHPFRSGDRGFYLADSERVLRDADGFTLDDQIFDIRVNDIDTNVLELKRPARICCMSSALQAFTPQQGQTLGLLVREEYGLFKGLVKTFLFVYSTLVSTMLALVGCKFVPGLHSRLSVSGSVVCFQPWQYLIWCILPLVLAMPWMLACLGSQTKLAHHLSKGVPTLRAGSVHLKKWHGLEFQKQLWWWPYYLAGLRGIVGAIPAVFTSEVCSSVAMTFVLILILVVHVWLQPHKRAYLQHTQSFLWLLLTCLAASTIGPAYLMAAGVEAQGAVGEGSAIVNLWDCFVSLAMILPSCILGSKLVYGVRRELWCVTRCVWRNRDSAL